MPQIDIGALTAQMARVMTGTLTTYRGDAAAYAQAEAEKIAISIRQIAELYAAGKIDAEEAGLKLDIQKNTSRIMLVSLQGIGILAAEQAINGGLAVVRDAVNSAIGFALI